MDLRQLHSFSTCVCMGCHLGRHSAHSWPTHLFNTMIDVVTKPPSCHASQHCYRASYQAADNVTSLALLCLLSGLGNPRVGLHPVQERLATAHGSQCGFCTPGFVMSMYALLRSRGAGGVSEEEIEENLAGNLWCVL